ITYRKKVRERIIMKSRFFIATILVFCFTAQHALAEKKCSIKSGIDKVQCSKYCPKASQKKVKVTTKIKSETRVLEEENALISFVKDKVLFFTRYFPDDTLLKNFFEIDNVKEQNSATKLMWLPN
ncbi:MAG: hypothetical protein ABI390_08500, partial [Daejeonella sp.]